MAELTSENYIKYCKITDEINRRLNTIYYETRIFSGTREITSHKDYKWLVKEYGDKLVPYLFHVMTHTGTCWMHLIMLSEITGENPVIDEGHSGVFYTQIAAWLNWYLKSKYYPSDVYHGLV